MSELYFEGNHLENGYRPVFYSEGWRVAYLNNTTDEVRPIVYMERHTLSDETFVLTEGESYLVVSPTGYDQFSAIHMEIGQVYNIPSTTFHGVYCYPGGRMLIMENADVGPDNSELHYLTEEELKEMMQVLPA